MLLQLQRTFFDAKLGEISENGKMIKLFGGLVCGTKPRWVWVGI